jgi:hypothetical protein
MRDACCAHLPVQNRFGLHASPDAGKEAEHKGFSQRFRDGDSTSCNMGRIDDLSQDDQDKMTKSPTVESWQSCQDDQDNQHDQHSQDDHYIFGGNFHVQGESLSPSFFSTLTPSAFFDRLNVSR